MINQNSIAIVGLGVSGLCTLTSLIDSKNISSILPEIIIVDPNPIKESNIFHCASNEVYLNTSAGLNSIVPDEENHFYDWAVKNESDIKSLYQVQGPIELETFLPRNVYLHYMNDVFQLYAEKAKKMGIKIKIIKQYLKNINIEEKGYSLELENGETVEVAQVVFSIGDGNCKNHFAHLEGLNNFFWKPCVPQSRYEQVVGTARSVLILGTMLSAVDALLLLQRFSVEICMASKTGTFPSVRSNYLDKQENYSIFRNVDNINTLLEKLLEKLPSYLPSENDIDDLGRPADQEWCLYIAPFLNSLNNLWPSASEEDRISFKKIFESYRVKRFMSSIPKIVADLIYPKIKSKQITVRKGLEKVDSINGKFVAFFEDGEQKEFDICINATAATNNSKLSLNLKDLPELPTLHIIGDSNRRNYINNGIFLFMREVERVLPMIKRNMVSKFNAVEDKVAYAISA